MMGKKDGQLCLTIVNLEELIPKNHLLNKINRAIDFNFIYDIAQPYYAEKGRPSIDPVCMIKMLLVGYLYGIRSERRLEDEITLNIAYRWFCGFNIMDRIPDHSVFSQNRRRRFNDSMLFRDIFNEIVICCIANGIITGDTVVSDGSFIPGNVSANSKIETATVVSQSTVKYMEALDKELSELPGYREPVTTEINKMLVKSKTDPDCGYIHQERKKGIGYLTEMTVDTKHGIITGVDCYPANQRESDIILKHVISQIKDTGISIDRIALDAGYDIGAVHRGFELLGITDYCCPREMHNNALKKGFSYDSEADSFVCMKKKRLKFYRITYKQYNQSYYRLYRISRKECLGCEYLKHCAMDKGAIRINASGFYPAYHANRERCKTADYYAMRRLRSIWSEGTFAALKDQHNLKRIKKRGIHRATEECLLAALALNLKRIAKVLSPKYSPTSIFSARLALAS
jgi:transposase